MNSTDITDQTQVVPPETSDTTENEKSNDNLLENILNILKHVPIEPGETSGYLIKIIGPVFGGKTTDLINRLIRASDVGVKVAYINHTSDVRPTKVSTDFVTSHGSGVKTLPTEITKFKVTKLSEIDPEPYSLIGIDEGQFFSDLETTVRKWKMDHGKRIIVSCLSGDFQNNIFGNSCYLEPITDELVIRKAYCKICKEERNQLTDAFYSSRVISSTKQKIVGGGECYIPTCLSCWKRVEKCKELILKNRIAIDSTQNTQISSCNGSSSDLTTKSETV